MYASRKLLFATKLFCTNHIIKQLSRAITWTVSYMYNKFTFHIMTSSCSLAIVLPTYAELYLNVTTPVSVDEGVSLLEPDLAKILIAPWYG